MLSWHQTRNGLAVMGLGCQDLLALPMTAFFASRQCPGCAIRAAMDWALQQARSKNAVISGFHSPLEQSVLTVLIEARSPVVAVLARPVECARLPPEWTEPLAQGLMAVVSVATAATRLTGEVATARNNLGRPTGQPNRCITRESWWCVGGPVLGMASTGAAGYSVVE
jgi:hypothetical protein